MNDITHQDADDLALVDTLYNVFFNRVRTDAYITNTGRKDEDGHPILAMRALLDRDALFGHVSGRGPRVGTYLIKPGEDTTQIAVLDFDSHKGEIPWPDMVNTAARVAGVLDLVGLVANPFISGGGSGIHLIMVWDAPEDAYSVRALLTEALAACNLSNGAGGVSKGQVEVFPKQDRVAPGRFGNQVWLPFAGKSEPLDFDLGCGLGREAGISLAFRRSEPVPRRERPVQETHTDTVLGAEYDRLRTLLGFIDPEVLDYDEWFKVGLAIHHETGGAAEGLSLWIDWSARSSKHEDDLMEYKWDSMGQGSSGALVTGGTLLKMARDGGWDDPVGDDEFAPLPEGEVYVPPVAGSAPAAPASIITEAIHPCSDQANANRLVRSFKTRIMVVGGVWYAWSGKFWETSEGAIYNIGMRLSAMVQREVDALRAALVPRVLDWARAVAEDEGLAFNEADFDADRWIGDQVALAPAKRVAELAEDIGTIAARMKWGAKCESKATLDAALLLAKKVLEVDPDKVDADPWLLNCPNGTVDLRTGALKPHDPADRITRMTPVEYDPAAAAPAFERALAMITCEDQAAARPVADFLQRWFGYCITGSVTEQKFVVHWGSGGNGKSLLLETLSNVVGAYASTAAPGLLTGEGERNLAAIADLMGRRMVTASESDEGANLREGQVKQITGSDKLKGRHLYAQLVEFNPTHKVQLLTNHKPVVKGTDEGIWRRVLLVPYRARFGSAAEVATGSANHIKDTGLLTALAAEYPGILAWLVRGAMEWHCGGLREPDVVRVASNDYRAAQDRIATFLRDECETGVDFEIPLNSEAMFGERPAIYRAYKDWCRDCGFHPLALPKFEAEIERAVPCFRRENGRQRAADGGGKKKVVVIFGVRTLAPAV